VRTTRKRVPHSVRQEGRVSSGPGKALRIATACSIWNVSKKRSSWYWRTITVSALQGIQSDEEENYCWICLEGIKLKINIHLEQLHCWINWEKNYAVGSFVNCTSYLAQWAVMQGECGEWDKCLQHTL